MPLNHKTHIYKGLLTLIITCCTNFIFAQTNEQVIKYSTANGLSINTVNDLLFDKQGFLWVATSDGLQRFDGYHFKTYKNVPSDSTSLPNNLCFSLWEDVNENIWIASTNTICKKSANSNLFQKIDGKLSNEDYKIFAEDVNYLWASTFDSIMLLNKKNMQIAYRYKLVNDELTPELLTIIKSNSLESKKVIDAYLHNNNNTITLDNLIFNLPYFRNAKHKKLYEWNINPSNFSNTNILKFSDAIIYATKLSNTEFLLIVKDKGAYIYNNITKKIEEHPNNAALLKNIDFPLLRAVVVDNYKNVWLGHSGQRGMVCVKNNNHPFEKFISINDKSLIYGMQVDTKNNFYVSFFNYTTNIYTEQGQIKNKFNTSNTIANIRAMKMVDDHNMLLLNVGSQVLLYNNITNKIIDLTNQLPKRDYGDNGVFDKQIMETNNGFIFNICRELIRLKMVNGKPILESIFKNNVQKNISAFCSLPNNNWLIGTTEGLYSCTANASTLVQGMPITHIKCITVGANNKIWVTSTSGIYVLQNGKLIKTLNQKNGLLNEFVYGALIDKAGNAWCGSNNGLIRIDTTYNIKTFNQTNGLLSDEFNTNGFLAHPNGNFYFASLGGINYFNPNTFVEDTIATEVKLTDIKVNYEQFEKYKTEGNEIYLSLPFNKNNLSLSFAVMDYFDVKNNQFKYFLQGFQPQWSIPTTNNEVNYILPPGDYTLQVHGKNHNGLWTKTPLLVHISIVPTWYQTIWFKVALALASLLLIGSLFYFYNKRKYTKKVEQLKMQQQVQFEKERLSRDLHDNLGSQLALLSNNVAHLDTSNKKNSEVTEDIDRLKNTSKQLLQTLRETLWILDKDEVKAEEFFDKLIEYTSRYLQSYPAIQLKIEENFANTKMINANNALQLFRICQEAINNACKYSNTKSLLLKGIGNSNNVQIIIADKGCGFDRENIAIENHYGLKNMQQRATSIGATLKIDSKINEGTSIEINIKP